MNTALDADTLRARLVAPNGPYAALDVVASTESTNHDLARARDAADRTVLIAEEQTAGQGRRGRGWVSPPGAGIYLSALFRPEVPAVRLPWLTLLAGVALVRVSRALGVEAELKWPNDLLLGPDRRKGAGVLAQIARSGVVVLGIGLNVRPLPADVPLGPGGLPATSLADEGVADPDRTAIAAHLLTELAELEARWRAAGGDPEASGALAEYRAECGTFGQRVRVELVGEAELVGVADDLTEDGTLLVRTDDGERHPVTAGDVVHLRPAK